MTSPFGGDVIDNPIDQPRAPSSLGYWIGALLIVAGIGGGIFWGVTKAVDFQDAIDGFERAPVGQISTIELDEGDYVVYAERGGGDPLSLVVGEVRMRPAGGEGADEIEFEDYTSEFTYDIGTRAGRAQLTFSIDDAGAYRVRVEDLNSATTAAFGPSVASDLVSAIVGAFVIAIVGIVAGVILLIVTGVRRRRFRQRGWLDAWGGPGAATTAGTWNPPPPAPGGWNPPPPPPAGGYPPPDGGFGPPAV